MPSLGADMKTGTLCEWLVKPGQNVKRGDLIAVVSTDKGDIEVEVWEDGVVDRFLVKEGEEVPVDTVLALLRSDGEAAAPAQVEIPASSSPQRQRVKASPKARTLAKKLGLDLSTVNGTGPGGAIQVADVERASEAPPQATEHLSASPLARKIAEDKQVPLETVHGSGPHGKIVKSDVEAVAQKKDPQAAIRRAIAAAMSRSNAEIPHYYLKTRIDMKRALDWLEQRNREASAQDRILPVALLARAVVKALGRVPELNAHWKGDEHRLMPSVNLGFAISLRQGGVMTPALREAEKLDLAQLMTGIGDLIERTRTNKLRASELNTATITLTNLGDRGVEEVYGVIYPPQVALVGFGKILDQPWAENGMLGIRPVVSATLAADHRATDGRVGARFLEFVNNYLQKPEKL